MPACCLPAGLPAGRQGRQVTTHDCKLYLSVFVIIVNHAGFIAIILIYTKQNYTLLVHLRIIY